MKKIYLMAFCLLMPLLTFAYPARRFVKSQNPNAVFSWKIDSSFQLPDAIKAIAIEGRDQGVRFIDLNGDGLSDVVYHTIDNGITYSGAWLNTGSGWIYAPAFIPPEPITIQGKDNGVRFLDLNGNTLPDMVYSTEKDGKVSSDGWINTGSGWMEEKDYAPPVAVIKDGKDNGARFVALSGSGLLDLVVANARYANAWKNNSQGWQPATSFTPPVPITINGVDNGVRFLSLTGNSLSDMVIANINNGKQHVDAWLNNGTTWVENKNFAPPTLITTDGKDNGVRFIDFTGDNLPDLVVANQSCANAWTNTGTGWKEDSAAKPPVSIAIDGEDNGVRFSDVNGDQLPEMLLGNFSSPAINSNAWQMIDGKWQEAKQYTPPVVFTMNGSDYGVRLVDVNGDGSPDIIEDTIFGGKKAVHTWVASVTS